MSASIKTVWYRMVERVRALPAAWRQRPAPDLERNDSVLGNVSETDPTLRALQDNAFARFDVEMTAALDVSKAASLRLSHLDRAAGVAAFLSDVESVRERARADEEMRRQQAEARVKARRGA